MKIFARFFIFTLALILICGSAVSCNDTEDTDAPADETSVEYAEGSIDGLIITKDGKSELSVWVEERVMTDQTSNTAVKKLIEAIKEKTGVQLSLINDKNYSDNYASKPAILIGKTKFAESKRILELEKNEFSIEASGNKLLIMAGDVQGYSEAINEFIEKIVNTASSENGLLVFKSTQALTGTYNYTVKLSAAEELKLWIEESKKTADYESMKNLKVNVIGDSYLRGHTLDQGQTWHGLLSKKYDWTVNNYAVNGCALASGSTCTYGTPIVERFTEMPDNNADLIIFDGGRNDYSHNVPIGDINSTDTTTFMGAMNVLADGLKQKYPNATIVYMSVWNFPDTNDTAKANGITYLDYANAAQAVCEAKGIHYFKSYDKSVSGVDMRDSSFRSTYCVNPNDISHLNLEGMKLVMPRMESFIAEAIQSKKN